MQRLILASMSPRRAALLRERGYRFEVHAPPFREPDSHAGSLSPAEHAEATSYFKARSVADEIGAPALVLGADTVVASRGRLYGKPADADDARRILRDLTGIRHQVITGVTLIDAATGTRLIRHDVTHVRMRPMTDGELDEYIASGRWEGKAGAYGIQDQGDPFVEAVEGSLSNVVGLPMELLERMLASVEGSEGRQASP